MKPIDPVARVLLELIGNLSVSRSAVGARAKTALRSLFDAGALKEERSGTGWRIFVTNPEALERFADALYPQGLDSVGGKMGRADAVAALRNAKRGSNRSGEPVLIRGFSDASLVLPLGRLDVLGITHLCGSACFVLSDEVDWKYNGDRVALVENLEPFLRFEERFNDFDAAIYCAGRMSERFLRWLEFQTFDIVHFGDYDPVGLQEFIRLKEHSGCRATLYVPENLARLVQRYGKPELLKDSSAILSGLRSTNDSEIYKVLQCLENFGQGLEQEVLWADLLSVSEI